MKIRIGKVLLLPLFFLCYFSFNASAFETTPNIFATTTTATSTNTSSTMTNGTVMTGPKSYGDPVTKVISPDV